MLIWGVVFANGINMCLHVRTRESIVRVKAEGSIFNDDWFLRLIINAYIINIICFDFCNNKTNEVLHAWTQS